MFSVVPGECLHRLGRQTREATDVLSYLIAQRMHWICGPFRGVIPAFQRRAAEAELQARERMAPALAAGGFWAACNSPAAGGAANSGPTIAKRSRAHRSRGARSFSSLNFAPSRAPSSAPLMGTKAAKPSGRRLSASSAGASQPSDYLVVVRVLKGAIKRRIMPADPQSPAWTRSRRLSGSRAIVTGGMNRSRADCQNGVNGSPTRHQVRHRRNVRVGMLNSSHSACPRHHRAGRTTQHHRQIHAAAGKPYGW